MVVSEQQIINAICMYVADKKQIAPANVTVELCFDDDYGFSAEVEVDQRQQVLVEANLIEALRKWLHEEYGYDQYSIGLRLILDDEGIIAKVRV